ncbi:MAG TPA: NAD(+) synthase [Gemmatimonadales bacterium]|nr:NAD(+) synthase [Gemmatimonadales bacterium]
MPGTKEITVTTMPAERLHLDLDRATRTIADALRTQVGEVLGRSGLVVAMSGGVDSSVCAGLAVQAVGAKRVLGLALPERDSDPESLGLAREWAATLGIEFVVEDITPALEGAGCYARRDAAVKRVVPAYGAGWRCKLVLDAGGLAPDRLHVCHLAVQAPEGEIETVRLPSREFREIVAATNFKQRVRKMMEYYHADRLHYAVVGTPNRLEYDQGFFVKGGDGLADVKPIAHLYKSQVFQLAEHLGVPAGIRGRTPTTDTYSLPQTQEEFFFSLPLRELDLVLEARNSGRAADEVARDLGLTAAQVERVYRDIDWKRRATQYLHLPPLLVEPVAEADARSGGTR